MDKDVLIEAVLASGVVLPAPGPGFLRLQAAAADENAGPRELAAAISQDPAITGALLALAVGQGLLVPSLATLLSRASAAHEQGGVLGIGQSLGSLARALGPPLAGTLFDQGAARPYVLATALMLTVAVLILGARPAPAA